MRPVFLFLLIAASLVSCAPRKLAKRMPGNWRMDHYNEWTQYSDTQHDLDNPGYIRLRRNGRGTVQLTPGRPHGLLEGRQSFQWNLRDSLLTLRYPDGRNEEWLVTSGYDIYMQWVSVSAARDTVRTVYVAK